MYDEKIPFILIKTYMTLFLAANKRTAERKASSEHRILLTECFLRVGENEKQ